MAQDPRREQVVFKKSKDWDNFPKFETRLNHAFFRVRQILTDGRIISVVLFFFFISIFAIISLDKTRLIDGLLSLSAACIVSWVGTIITIYWNLDSIYGRKWEMFFDKWHAINMLDTSPDEKTLLFLNLYMDVITMKLWGDPGISATFKAVLIDAIKKVVKEPDVIIYRLGEHDVDVYEGYGYLAAYAKDLEKKVNSATTPLKLTPPA